MTEQKTFLLFPPLVLFGVLWEKGKGVRFKEKKRIMEKFNVSAGHICLRGYRCCAMGRQNKAAAGAVIFMGEMVKNACICMHFLDYNADYEAVRKNEGAKNVLPFSSPILLSILFLSFFALFTRQGSR